MKRGILTERQYRVLVCRGRGMSQRETARELRTTRANISMIELRARRKVERARETLRAYESTLTDHSVVIDVGTGVFEIPSVVLREGDRYGIHIQSDIVDIIRMARDMRPRCLVGGRTKREIVFVFNQKGKLTVRPGSK